MDLQNAFAIYNIYITGISHFYALYLVVKEMGTLFLYAHIQRPNDLPISFLNGIIGRNVPVINYMGPPS